jgi:hypothetical protein
MGISVFLSYPNPHTCVQQTFCARDSRDEYVHAYAYVNVDVTEIGQGWQDLGHRRRKRRQVRVGKRELEGGGARSSHLARYRIDNLSSSLASTACQT